MNLESLEKTGPNFSVGALMTAHKKTHEGVQLIGEQIKSGMTEEEAHHLARETLIRLGSTKGWHKILIRFGPNISRIFRNLPMQRCACATAIFSLSISDPFGMGLKATLATPS